MHILMQEVSGGESFTLVIGEATGTYNFRFPNPMRETLAKALMPLCDSINDREHAGWGTTRAESSNDGLMLWSIDPTERVQARIQSASPSLRYNIVESD